jgi:hypothetical protein
MPSPDFYAGSAPLMPGVGDDRAGIAIELVWASHQVICLLAGIEAEKFFTAAPLPGTDGSHCRLDLPEPEIGGRILGQCARRGHRLDNQSSRRSARRC